MHAVAENTSELERKLTQPNTRFLPQLDLLRTVAVLLVVFDHTELARGHERIHGVLIGYVGVTGVFMFFVHTSLVLMWSLERKPFTLDFYVRRIFRVYPLAIAATLGVVLTHAPLSLGTVPYFLPYPVTLKNFIANIFLVFDLMDAYTGAHALLHVEWTLPWELQMYILLPVLYAFVRQERTLWTLLLLWLFSVGVDHHWNITPLSFPGSIPNFLSGVIAFLAYKRFRPRFPAWTFPLFLFCAVAVLTATSVLKYCWIFTLVLGLSLPFFHSFRRSHFTTAFQLAARYSYGIYLAHPFGIWIGIWFLRHHSVPLQIGVELLVTAILSVGSYHLLEKPMIDLGARLAAYLEVRALGRHEVDSFA